MRHSFALALVITFLVASGWGATPEANDSGSIVFRKSLKTKVVKPYQVGVASWYGKRFHGRPTASGEPYDMFLFTAAHRQLPLGTWVMVTNLRNGKRVTVRINDRGPYTQNPRIIDVSYSAAQMLGLRARGTEWVRLDLVPVRMTARLEAVGGKP